MSKLHTLPAVVTLLVLGFGTAVAQTESPMEPGAQKSEIVGTVTRVDGQVYTIRDFRGMSHELPLENQSSTWGSVSLGSKVKARVENEKITELVNLDE